MRQRKIAGTVADPTMPKTPITLNGKTYNLCFDLGALAEAETAINAELVRAGSAERVNLLFALPAQNLASTRIIFAAALRVFHPEIGFEEARRMIDWNSGLYDVALAIRDAWEKSAPDPEPDAHPPQPGA